MFEVDGLRQGGEASDQGLSKLQWGSYLAAALAYLLIRQNDAVGLMLFDTKVRTYIPPKAIRRSFDASSMHSMVSNREARPIAVPSCTKRPSV